jgi:hypothetical protein
MSLKPLTDHLRGDIGHPKLFTVGKATLPIWPQTTVNNFVAALDRFGWLSVFIVAIRFDALPAPASQVC